MLDPILHYLAQTEGELRAALEAAGDRLNQAPSPGTWTPAQNALHLIVTERWMYPLWTFVPKLGRSPRLLRTLDSTYGALWRSLGMRTAEEPTARPDPSQPTRGRFIAPVFLRPSSAPVTLDDLWERRARRRERTMRAIARVPEADLVRLEWSHPLLGRYTLLEFVRFLGIHESRHAAQILRTLP